VVICALTNSLADQRSGLGPLSKLRCVKVFLVAEGREDILSVAVPVDVQRNADGIAKLADKFIETLVLWSVGGLLTTINLGAGICGSTALVGVPAEFPVAVDIATVA